MIGSDVLRDLTVEGYERPVEDGASTRVLIGKFFRQFLTRKAVIKVGEDLQDIIGDGVIVAAQGLGDVAGDG